MALLKNIKNPGLADRLNPVLVLELRLSLRTKSFLTIFILTQLAMVCICICGLAQSKVDAYSGHMFESWFWMLIGALLYAYYPLLGLRIVSREYRLQCSETLLMSGLQPFRIIYGKWLAIVLQQVLVLISILPYFTLRYFVGGHDILAELGALTAMFFTSLVFCSACIMMSAIKSNVGRVCVVVLGGLMSPLIFYLPGIMIGGAYMTHWIFGMLVSILFGLGAVFIFLGIGSTTFAECAKSSYDPLAE